MSACPGRLALCGVPCGCNGQNRSHYPSPLRRCIVHDPWVRSRSEGCVMTTPLPRCPSEWVRPSTGTRLRCDRHHGHNGRHTASETWGRFWW